MKSFARLLAAIAAWICILLPATGVAAEATGMPIPAANERGPRIAVVIGNAKYPSGSLANPRNDATAMAEALTLLGFQVDLKLDATKADIDAIFRRFSARADSAAVAALFYAGHGIQVAGSNYIVPIDANPRHERDLKRDMVKMDDVIDDMGAARVKLVFFDACRDNPLARSFSRGSARGMAAPVEATGTLISFATKHGNTAADGEGKHSPYATALLSALRNPAGVEIEQMLRGVQQSVKQATNGQQEPWRYGSLDGDFYFKPPDPADSSRVSQAVVDRAVEEATRKAKEQAEREKAELQKSIKALQEANERAIADALKAQRQAGESAVAEALRRSNEQAAREREELQKSMEKMLKDALDKQKLAGAEAERVGHAALLDRRGEVLQGAFVGQLGVDGDRLLHLAGIQIRAREPRGQRIRNFVGHDGAERAQRVIQSGRVDQSAHQFSPNSKTPANAEVTACLASARETCQA